VLIVMFTTYSGKSCAKMHTDQSSIEWLLMACG
jgi:hypothetical protein